MPLGRRTFLLTAGAAAALPATGLAWMDHRIQGWKAHWIYMPGLDPHAFGVCHFRRGFDLAAAPAKFVVHVTGDSRYELYCNGEKVSWGPARGDLTHWHYETVDLAPKLKAGHNVLAAVVYNDGTDAALAQFSIRTAFLLQAADGADEAVNTGKEWRCAIDEAYQPSRRADVGGYSAIGPMENFDAARYPWGWQNPDFDDSKWAAAEQGDPGCPRGQQDAPSRWMLVPRPIPMGEETPEAIPALRRVEGVSGIEPGELKFPLRIPAGTRAVLLLDQKKLTTAFPVLTVQGGRGATLRMRYSEGLFETQPPQLKGNRDVIEGKVSKGYADTYIADGARRVHRTLFWRAFRYLQLEVETGAEPLTIEDLHGVYTGYPFVARAKFEGGTPLYQRILDTGFHTARLCAHETYMDCPYYEQLQYAGDTRIQSLVSVFMTGDARLMRNAIELLDSSRTAEGATLSRAPSTLPQYIPPFSLWWIAMVHDYWRYVDDPAFVREMLRGTHAVLDFYCGYLGKDHLLHDMPWWNFVDWVGTWPDGVPPMSGDLMPGVIQVQLLQALQQAAELDEFFGNTEQALTWRKRADALWQAIQATFWDARERHYTDDAAHKYPSQHINSLVVLCGRLPLAAARDLIDRVSKDKQMAQCTVYFRYYLDRALSAAGLGGRYLERLGTWQTMLNDGLTTWAETDGPAARSDCHAWGASPNIEFFRNVLGVDSAGPGFSKVRIRPNLGPLQSAQGVIPHPKGLIHIEVQRVGGAVKHKVTLPPGVTEVA